MVNSLVGERRVQSTGEAGMDRQWGDFDTYQREGWDWFSLQLDDGTAAMLYLVRDDLGEVLRVDVSFAGIDGSTTNHDASSLHVDPADHWRSSGTGVRYPSGWTITLPDLNLGLSVQPSLKCQELDTRRTTGVNYWKGEVAAGARNHKPEAGLGYGELTGYAPHVHL